MGRIQEPALSEIAERWSPIIINLLDELGMDAWKPKKIRRGLLRKPEIVLRHLVEGPAPEGQSLRWAVSHTSKPSAFDENGVLDEGEREYWIVTYHAGEPGWFEIAGAQTIEDIPVDEQALRVSLLRAKESGPRVETFYGNKGPLSHR